MHYPDEVAALHGEIIRSARKLIRHGWDTTGVVWHSAWDDSYDADNGKTARAKRRSGGRRPISYATRQWVKERDAYRCRHCGTHENLTVDHIVSVHDGGTNDAANLQTLCQSCNSRKGTRSGPDQIQPDDEVGR